MMTNHTTETRQLQRHIDKIRLPNDKLSKVVFTRSPEQMQRMIEQGRDMKLVEATIKGKPVKTTYRLKLVNGFVYDNPPDEFDRAVMGVCISAFEAGLDFITDRIIYRTLCGGKSDKHNLPADMRARIREAVDGLGNTLITVDMRAICKAIKKYGNRLPEPEFTSLILPCEVFDGKINGQPAQIIRLAREPPLMTVARAKEQILTFDAALLDVPSVRNTATAVKLKSYVLRRVMESKLHRRNMSPKITFGDVYEHCGLTDAGRKAKFDARQTIFALMDGLTAAGVIRSFEKEKAGDADTGGEYFSINVDYGADCDDS